ncbi:MAG: 4-(cytidine 5'-diphospho)-2-C-methyl-D-erythritol kinase [Tissierellia bacterium]|nr:4-(cytidine 5'-diphospho)-2-C-methyl-D-erythritol kinase [Tissierellia bacterium]
MNYEIKNKAYGKINLYLKILNKREDGYHDIDTLMQKIDLYDDVYIKKNNRNILNITCNDETIPTDETNLVHKVWDIMKEIKRDKFGIDVHIEKRIPSAAGLAGGSSDAHSMFVGLNEIWELGMKDDELAELSKKIGADLPFFFGENTMRGIGIGNELSVVNELPSYNILIVNNGKPLSSGEIYSKLDIVPNKFDYEAVIDYYSKRNFNELRKESLNDMESTSMGIYPEIEEIKQKMYKLGSNLSLMSGSGPTVYGIFEDEEKLEKAYEYFSKQYPNVYHSKTLN